MDILLLADLNSQGRFNNRDYALDQKLKDIGHTVSSVSSALPTDAFQPLVIVTTNSIDAAWKDDPRPIICMNSSVAKTLGLTDARPTHLPIDGTVTFTNPAHTIANNIESGIRVMGEFSGYSTTPSNGVVIGERDGSGVIITYEKGVSRFDSGTLPGRRVLFFPDGYSYEGVRWEYWEDWDVYVARTGQMLSNVIDWATAEPVVLNQQVTAKHLDLLSKLPFINFPAYKKTAIANYAAELGETNIDVAMFRTIQAAAQTERYVNGTLPREARRNNYRWRIDEAGRFRSTSYVQLDI